MHYLFWEELIKQTHVFEYLPGLLFDVLFNAIRDVMEKQLWGFQSLAQSQNPMVEIPVSLVTGGANACPRVGIVLQGSAGQAKSLVYALVFVD